MGFWLNHVRQNVSARKAKNGDVVAIMLPVRRRIREGSLDAKLFEAEMERYDRQM